MRLAIIVMGAALGAAPALAADAGWGVRFHYDAFQDKTYPMAAMEELTEGPGINTANIFMACKDGQVAVIFQPERYDFSSGGISGSFRGPEGVREFSFDVVDIPAFGRNRAVEGDAAQAIIDIFSTSPGPVPFQTEQKQGNFPVAGFQQVLTIMTEYCPTL